MSTPPNSERSPKKWFKQKFRSVFSSSRSSSRSLEGQSTGTNVPPINSPFDSDGPRIIADRTGSGKKIGSIHKYKDFNTFLKELSDVKPILVTGSSIPANVTTSTGRTSLILWLTMKDINSRP